MYNAPIGLAAKPVITDDMSVRGQGLHEGIDIGSPLPDNPDIYAIAQGKIVHAGVLWDFGNAVVLQHAVDYSLYAHLNSIAVGVGGAIAEGAKIGVMGETGKAYGRHLHIELFIPPGATWESAYANGDRWKCRKNPILEIAALGDSIPYRDGGRGTALEQKQRAFTHWVKSIATLERLAPQDVLDVLRENKLVDPKWSLPADPPSA